MAFVYEDILHRFWLVIGYCKKAKTNDLQFEFQLLKKQIMPLVIGTRQESKKTNDMLKLMKKQIMPRVFFTGTFPLHILLDRDRLYCADLYSFYSLEIDPTGIIGRSRVATSSLFQVDSDFGKVEDMIVSSNLLFVTHTCEILVLDTMELTLLYRFGTTGYLPGQFHFPTNLSVYHDQLFVLDWRNDRIQIFPSSRNIPCSISSL